MLLLLDVATIAEVGKVSIISRSGLISRRSTGGHGLPESPQVPVLIGLSDSNMTFESVAARRANTYGGQHPLRMTMLAGAIDAWRLEDLLDDGVAVTVVLPARLSTAGPCAEP